MQPYYHDDCVALYNGDYLEILKGMSIKFGTIIADPPYGETSLDWDRWPEAWPLWINSMNITNSLWCFGSLKMFMERKEEFYPWRISQEIVWEKHNGSNALNDRFRRVHELAVHFYPVDVKWSDVYKNPLMTHDAVKRTVRRKSGINHWGQIGERKFESQDGGSRLMRSVIYCKSAHGTAIHPTQKPIGIVRPLIEYSLQEGEVLLDLFSGSGTSLVIAKEMNAQAIGIEIDERQCEKTATRLSQMAFPL